MRLYTVQPRFVYDTLCNTGIFLSQPWKDGDNWICTDAPAVRLAYDWLCEEMVDRGLRRPGDSVYPIWAWYQYMGKKKPKPDLRYSDMKHYAQTDRHVLLSLDIQDENVLLHDYDAWHYPRRCEICNIIYRANDTNGTFQIVSTFEWNLCKVVMMGKLTKPWCFGFIWLYVEMSDLRQFSAT